MIGIISIAVKATLLIACAFLVAALARNVRASVRHGVFAALFAALLLLPLAPGLVRTTPVAVPQAVSAAIELPAAPPPSPAAAEGSAPVVETTRSSWSWLMALRNVYGAGTLVLLASLMAGLWRVRRLAKRAETWLDGAKIAAEVASENGIRRAVLVVISREISVPLTFGFRRQTVMMPEAARRWSQGDVRRAIRHELEHVRRDDWMTQLVARVICAVYWPHPLVWAALRRFCLEAERACDDAVLAGSDAPEYATQLVTLARTLGRRPVPALAMASRSRLSERVHAILDSTLPRGPQSRRTALTTAAVLTAVVALFGSIELVAAARAHEDATTGDAIGDGVAGGVAEGVEEGVEGAFDYPDDRNEWIVQAAEKGDVRRLERLLTEERLDINTPLIGDGTPILIAARAGRKEAVQWMLDRGADPNVPSPGDGNALIAAAGAGQTGIMRMLLARGARVEDVVPGDENALITAAAAGSDQAVKLLIEHGANVNARVWADGREWRTPLSMAQRHGHSDIVRILLDAGALH